MSHAIPPFVFHDPPCVLPGGHIAVPIDGGQSAAAVRVCVVVNQAGAGALLPIREGLDHRVYLGCLVDAPPEGQARVHRWLEIWVQDIDGLASAVAGYREAMTNRQLDERWRARCAQLDRMTRAGTIRGEWEVRHPRPAFIDAKAGAVLHPSAPGGGEWRLCEADDALAALGAPAFNASAQRFLWVPAMKGSSPIVPVTRESGSDGPASIGSHVGVPKEALAFNPGGGLMMVTAHRVMSYEQYVDALSAVGGEGVSDGLLRELAGAAHGRTEGAATAPVAGGWLLLGEPGRLGRLSEIFHLKLRLLADAIWSVRTSAAETQTPMLSLTASSFRVGFPAGAGYGDGMPFLWNARAELADIGEAVALPLKMTDATYYVAPGTQAASMYAPSTAARGLAGRATLRMRRVTTDAAGTVVEATLATHERFAAGAKDLVWLRFAAGGFRFDLYGLVEAQTALGSSELRIKTIAQRVSERESQALKGAEGVPVHDAMFELVPLLSTPCDLYALGVLAVRTLLVGGGSTLPVAMDELLSLAGEAARGASELGGTLGARIGALFKKDARWAVSLGPQRLVEGAIDPGDALDAVPARVWFDTLAMIARMFPGFPGESRYRDFGDAPIGAVHRVFDRTIEELAELLVKSRGLVVSDHGQHREVAQVLRAALAKV